MFYATNRPHGLPRSPFNALVVPRPIGWISSLSADGIANLAPYSFFNAVAYEPPQVMFAGNGSHTEGGLKDTVENIRSTGEFVVNLATWDLRDAMNASSAPAPRAVDEFDATGLGKAPAELVRPPRVAASPAHLECRMLKIVELDASSPNVVNRMVIGHVVGIHIDDAVLTDGFVDMAKLNPIARLGYMDYAKVTDVFSMERPAWPPVRTD